MAEEATSLLQQAASTMKCINVNAVSYPDGSDYITSYHFLSARMVRLIPSSDMQWPLIHTGLEAWRDRRLLVTLLIFTSIDRI